MQSAIADLATSKRRLRLARHRHRCLRLGPGKSYLPGCPSERAPWHHDLGDHDARLAWPHRARKHRAPAYRAGLWWVDARGAARFRLSRRSMLRSCSWPRQRGSLLRAVCRRLRHHSHGAQDSFAGMSQHCLGATEVPWPRGAPQGRRFNQLLRYRLNSEPRSRKLLRDERTWLT